MKRAMMMILFSLSGCAIEPEELDGSAQPAIEQTAVDETQSDDDGGASVQLPARQRGEDAPAVRREAFTGHYCEQASDCRSNVCDRDTYTCRDYPF